MKINNPQKRLSQFWGRVDRKHIESIYQFVKGNAILDMGCGFGTTTKYINQGCIGIDCDIEAIDYCKTVYPDCKFKVSNAESLTFEDQSFDTVILRDALHHFFQEAAFGKVRNEIIRVSKNNSRIIFFDPNINFMLRTMRKLSFHKDKECNFETAKQIMEGMGYKIIHTSFNTLYSLPLSGGYVGINFVPNIKFIQDIILYSERQIEKIINRMGLGRNICWRYLIVGEKV